MNREKIMVDLFEFSSPTYYKWTKHQKRKIFDLLDYAFTLEELEEYLTTNRIKRVDKEKSFEILENSSIDFLTKLAQETDYQYLNKIIKLFIEHYNENSNSISLELFAEKLYSKKIFFEIADKNYNAKMIFKTVDTFKNEHLSILNYICKNYDNLKTEIEKITDRLHREFFEIQEYDDYDMYQDDSENNYEDEDNGPELRFAFEMEDYKEKDE